MVHSPCTEPYNPLLLPSSLATMHDPVPILISVFASLLFGHLLGTCGSVPEMHDLLLTFKVAR